MDGRAKPSGRTMPVLAFASGAQGQAWTDRVRQGAESFGGGKTTFEEVPLHGHLDLLAGKLAASEVFEPSPGLAAGEVRPHRRRAVSARRRRPR